VSKVALYNVGDVLACHDVPVEFDFTITAVEPSDLDLSNELVALGASLRRIVLINANDNIPQRANLCR